MMTTDDIRALLTSGDLQPPFTVHTYSGKSYPVEDAACLFSPPGFPDAIVVVVPRRSIAVIRLSSISEVTCEEHEAVRAHE